MEYKTQCRILRGVGGHYYVSLADAETHSALYPETASPLAGKALLTRARGSLRTPDGGKIKVAVNERVGVAELDALTALAADLQAADARIAFAEDKPETALEVEPLEQVIDRLKRKIKNGHITRLREGNCTMELGFILSDLLTKQNKKADTVIRESCDEFEKHIQSLLKSLIDTDLFGKKYVNG